MITARSMMDPQARFGKSLDPGSPAGAEAFRVVLAMYMVMPAAIKKIKPMTVFPFTFFIGCLSIGRGRRKEILWQPSDQSIILQQYQDQKSAENSKYSQQQPFPKTPPG